MLDKAVLITGCSTGFGRMAAEALARRAYFVFATMRDIGGKNAGARAELETLAVAENLRLRVLELDVTEDWSVDAAVQTALQEAGRIDVVINNAGFANIGVTEAYTPEQFHQLFETNVYGVVRVNRAVLPEMRRRREGLLIHVSSGAGRVSIPCMAPYCASKFALEAIADAYRFELAPFGIDSVVVEPGIFKTPIFGKVFPPADQDRVADYGEAAASAGRVQGAFAKTISAPDAPAGEAVVDLFLRLIETPAGERPLRNLVGVATEGIQQLNATAESLRESVATRFNVPELLRLDTATKPLPAAAE